MTICYDRINALPEDGQLTDIRTIETETDMTIENLHVSNHNDQLYDESNTTNIFNTDPESDGVTQSGVDCPLTNVESEKDVVEKFVHRLSNDSMSIDYPENSEDPLSEYNTPFLASMAFPTLFPTGRGDPFAIQTDGKKDTLLNQVKNLLYYAELVENDIECRFAQHPRFVLWISNILQRRRTQAQGDVYVRQNLEDSTLTIDEIRSMIDNGEIDKLLKNLSRYMANIPGSSSYWNSVKNDLTSIIDTKGPPHAFFTHSYADFYDPQLHHFLNIPPKSPRNFVHQRLKKYPHLVNWFFVHKFKEFANNYYVKHLKACPEHGGWLWYRFEWQNRGAIHVHGLLRMGNIPDTCELANNCIRGHILSRKKNQSLIEKEEIIKGLNCEAELIGIFDEFVNCDTKMAETMNINALDQTKQKPHAMKFSEVLNHAEDEQNLITTLQRHTCKVGGCIKTIAGKPQTCRFKFPQELSPKTTIKYENKKKNLTDSDRWELHIVPKRVNSDRISSHNLIQLKHWRANVDFCIVHDYNKVIQYVAKYASKAETKSNAFKAAFEEVFINSISTTTDTHMALKKVMTKVLGLRDISMHEALHLTMSLDLHWSNIKVVRTSLNKSNLIKENTDTGNSN